MLHACVERFDVMGGRGNILGWDGEVNKARIKVFWTYACPFPPSRLIKEKLLDQMKLLVPVWKKVLVIFVCDGVFDGGWRGLGCVCGLGSGMALSLTWPS
jgi:hypothetical protein